MLRGTKNRAAALPPDGIGEGAVLPVNPGYRDPNQFDVGAWRNGEEESVLVVDPFGQSLHRLVSEYGGRV